MKKFIYGTGQLFIFFVVLSFKKDHEGVAKQVVIDTTLASGIQYQLNLQPYGGADDVAAITKQAASFTTSEIVNTSTGIFAPVNHYATAAKSILTDQVVIVVKEGSRGGNRGSKNCGHSTTIAINFKVL